MKCPFCDGDLQLWPDMDSTTYGCAQIGCVEDDMPRYQVCYQNISNKLLSLTFMLDQYYIRIHYPTDRTVVSKLIACFLMDTIEIKRAMVVDFDNLPALLEKIKTFLTFS
jgi:hypothetical protein